MNDDGRVIAGRYRLREPLGSGGMADVHVARDEVLDRDVAVKVLRATYLDDETFLERFRREARSAAGLSHRKIVAVHDTGSDDGVPYIVMELVPGRSLDHVLAERGRLEAGSAVAVLREVCDALAYAHDHGVVHRDVKPGNILVIEDDGSPTVKVADFGIARAAGDDTITLTSVLGTAAYLSPEQAQGERADHRADLYAAGIVLYELLTGAPPYSGGTAVQVALRHVGGQPEPPSEHVEGVSADLDAVVLTALAKEPDDRYQTAEAFRRDLEAVLAGEPVSVDRGAAIAAASGLAGGETLRLDDDTVAVGAVAGATATGPGDADPDVAAAAAGGAGGAPEEAAEEAAGEGGDGRSRRVPAVAALAVLLLFAALALLASRDGGAPVEQLTSTPVETTPASTPPPPPPDDGGGGDERPEGGGNGGNGGPPDDRGPPGDRGRDG